MRVAEIRLYLKENGKDSRTARPVRGKFDETIKQQQAIPEASKDTEHTGR
jgi:hypothetical protein